ncbi:MAG TPA: EamA family transporter [Marinilabiliales bacterium]|jgi:drug/metabolite transporter (DMT)-like permease|nr:MAG: hypothetical protein A2W95_15900 [Bacteroidetes bacterium GWA2_40_14]OFX58425.1 MAG: hypothetical protein A2W84_10220 [Bacteroidetes bacterium GWC2_40_13]OFX71962.1 MAG: hypothetical protein A2W96_03305 [Bacteroidetes bacterium GWD2_40_43]OFX89473.1 MAG: hypothetical protein A2W97_14055 [Bacteroidetes bacterium GWE2_40_63]OFY23298.1 MAG: hypothetical protein A2W88_19715 [Bacteroidetes bacterium GWF2_40_13]OFZ28091.1 MAG: hypothetical protein A2437_04275 [Bacteroidetes bacterium RIFOXYC
MKNNSKAIFFALLSVLLWSTVAVPFKIGLSHFHYIHFVFITITIAVLVSFVALLLQKKLKLLRILTRKELQLSVFGGFLNPFLYYLILFKAYSILPAQIAQALNYTWPIMLVLLSVPFLGQKLKLKSMATLLLGFMGVYFIASQGQPWPLKPAQPFGVMLAIGSSVIWASFWIINTKSVLDVSLNLFLNFCTGWVLTVPLLFLIPLPANIPIIGWSAAVYSGVFEMGITFIVWLMALKLADRSDTISNFVFLSPFMSLFFIYLILHEQIYLTTLLGLGLIIAAIFIDKWMAGQKKSS